MTCFKRCRRCDSAHPTLSGKGRYSMAVKPLPPHFGFMHFDYGRNTTAGLSGVRNNYS